MVARPRSVAIRLVADHSELTKVWVRPPRGFPFASVHDLGTGAGGRRGEAGEAIGEINVLRHHGNGLRGSSKPLTTYRKMAIRVSQADALRDSLW